MPIYEYLCDGCGTQSELLVYAEAKPDCPKCGGKDMRKLLSIVAAPNRDTSAGGRPSASGGSCGAGCGCHPH